MHINEMYGLNALLNLRACQCFSRRDLMHMEDTLSRSITLLNCSPEPQYGRQTALLDLPILQINHIKHLITAIEEESDPFTLPLTPSGPHVSGTAPLTSIDELLFLCLDSLLGKWAGLFRHCHHKGRRVPKKRPRSLIIKEANGPLSVRNLKWGCPRLSYRRLTLRRFSTADILS